MNDFDARAQSWDNNPMHWDRSEAIATRLLQMVPVNPTMNALEFGAGTGILSSMLSPFFSTITMVDQSIEMVRMMQQKVQDRKYSNLIPLHLDVEQDSLDTQYDLVFSQMVFHHLHDIHSTIHKLREILLPGGYLAIADLYPEDGSFHGPEFKGHHGFEPDELGDWLKSNGFSSVDTKPCFTVHKIIGDTPRKFPMFLMVAQKQ